MPAWLVRDGQRRPVRPGMVLQGNDRLITGGRARLLLRLAEGSFVKLGENAVFELTRLDPPKQSDGAFSGVLNVLKGAFRFTTSLLSKSHRRNLDIRIAGVTAGIRGTDLWGKAAPDRDIVCLIEGRISVQRGDDAPIEINDPLSFYIAPKGKPALPVAPVSPEQLAIWAQETEIARGAGALRGGGVWRINLASYREAGAANARLATVQAAGYAADVVEVDVNGERWHRVSISSIAGYGDALGLVDDFAGQRHRARRLGRAE